MLEDREQSLHQMTHLSVVVEVEDISVELLEDCFGESLDSVEVVTHTALRAVKESAERVLRVMASGKGLQKAATLWYIVTSGGKLDLRTLCPP